MQKIHSIDSIIETATAFRLLSKPLERKILRSLDAARSGLSITQLARVCCISEEYTARQLGMLESYNAVFKEQRGTGVTYKLARTPFTRKLKEVSYLPDSS